MLKRVHENVKKQNSLNLYNGHADVTALINATTGAMDATYYYECAKQSLAVSVGENLTQEKASHHPVTVDLRPYW